MRLFPSSLGLGVSSLLFSLAALTSFAQTPPAGSWDFVLSGHKRGVAQITFLADGTLSGTTVYTFLSKTPTQLVNGFTFTNAFGAAALEGSWAFNGSNRITGFINEIALAPGSSTNFVTNGASFRAVVKPTRVGLLAFGSQGKVSFKGVPLAATNDVSGTYVGTARSRGVPFPFIEIFNLTPFAVNDYDVTGGGPGYNYSGQFLLSRQRFAAFFQSRGQTASNALITVYAGGFNPITRRGMLLGTDGVRTRIQYKMAPQGP